MENGRGPEHQLRVQEDAVLEKVREAIRGIEYGSVLLKIHQGEVVGIETATKVRLKGSPNSI